jgi:flavodoxin
MRYAIIYWSRFGNNERIAQRLKELLRPKGDVDVYRAGSARAMPRADVYVFCAAAERFGISAPMKSLMKGLSGMEGKYAIINTHALKFKSWLGRMDKLLSKSGLTKAAELDFVMGDGTDKGQGLPEGWESKLAELAGKL